MDFIGNLTGLVLWNHLEEFLENKLFRKVILYQYNHKTIRLGASGSIMLVSAGGIQPKLSNFRDPAQDLTPSDPLPNGGFSWISLGI